MNEKRIISMISAAALVVPVLAACGGGSKTASISQTEDGTYDYPVAMEFYGEGAFQPIDEEMFYI